MNSSAPHEGQDVESSPLLEGENSDPDVVFSRALDAELEKVCSFYQLKELEVYGEVETLLNDEQSYEAEHDGFDGEGADGAARTRHQSMTARARQGSAFRAFGFGRPRATSTLSGSVHEEDEDADSDDDADETKALNKQHSKPSRRARSKTLETNGSNATEDLQSSREFLNPRRRPSQAFEDFSDQALSTIYDSGITLKKRTISLYVTLCELKSFVQLNKTGFSKALKKYDKTVNRALRRKYTDAAVTPALPFRPITMQHLDENIEKLEEAYSRVVTKGDVSLAKKELRLHLREHVVWERNTVWREMIGIERKAQAANMGLRRTLLGGDQDPSKARLQGDEDDLPTKEVVTPVGRYRCPKWLLSSTFYALVMIVAVFVTLLLVPIMEKPEQQNCLAMLIFVSLLWATEVSRYIQFHPRSSFLIHDLGHPPFRHLPPNPLPRGRPAHIALRREAILSTGLQGCHQASILSHVDASDHAATGRLHDRRSALEIPHREDDGHFRAQQGWNQAADCAGH